MSFKNLDYLYNHLPGRFRRDDKGLVLKRFLTWFGETLDGWDATFDTFYQSITPATASAIWVTFWLRVLFDWSWFPAWFTLADKRRLYGNFARHLARRGTRVGIEMFLRDFGIVARVYTRSEPWGEFVWDEASFAIPEPLNLIVEILEVITPPGDMCFYEESFVWGEGFYAEPVRGFTDAEILALVRFQQPVSQNIYVLWATARNGPSLDDQVYWKRVQW